MDTNITKAVVTKLIKTIDAGLVKGVGRPIPGQMCVEAAVCYAMGLPHGDSPSGESPAMRASKMSLNDKGWSSNAIRASGLKRLALIQLGSAGVVDDVKFTKLLVDYAIRKSTPLALRSAAKLQTDHKHKAALLNAAMRCEEEGTANAAAYAANAAANGADAADAAEVTYAAYAAYAACAAYAAYAADAAAYAAADAAAWAAATYAAADAAEKDKILADYAEDVVQMLVKMRAPGRKWLKYAPLTR